MPLQEVSASNTKALQEIANAITKSHKVLVITGAGISTNCGIPDFRSKDGLYNMIPDQAFYPTPPSSEPSTPSRKRKASVLNDDEPPSSQSSTSSRNNRRCSNSPASRMKGQDLFHARVFQNTETTEVFYQFIASLRQKIHEDVKATSATHKFIRTLRDGGRLMRCYTQNIDGLEQREGLCMDLARGKGNKRRFMKKHYESPRPEDIENTDFDGGCEVVQLHGELTKLRCTMCSAEEDWTAEATETLLEGCAPKCEQCVIKSDNRLATGKRGLTVGALRPNIVLYGEEHPQNTLLSPFVPYDVSSKPDVLIIMGTSLKVHGLQKIIRDFAKAVHEQKNGRVVFVNRTRPAESVWDGIIDEFVAMDCDDWVKDLRTRREDLWLRQGEISLKEIKQSTQKRKRNSVDTPQDDADMTSKKAKVNKSSKISVDIPKRDRATNAPADRSPKKMKSIRATPWSKKHMASTSRPKQSGIESQSTPGKRKLATQINEAISPSAQSRTPSRRPLSTPRKISLYAEVNSENNSGYTETPKQPMFSPITPAYTPLTATPSSRNRKVVYTPSRLRVTTDAGDATNNDENIDNSTRQCSKAGKSDIGDSIDLQDDEDGENRNHDSLRPSAFNRIGSGISDPQSDANSTYNFLNKNRKFVHKLLAITVSEKLLE